MIGAVCVCDVIEGVKLERGLADRVDDWGAFKDQSSLQVPWDWKTGTYLLIA